MNVPPPLGFTIVEWTLIGVLVTAAGAVAAAVVSALIYGHGRTVAAHRQAVQIRRGLLRSTFIEQGVRLIGDDAVGTMALVHMFNRSEIRQQIEFDLHKSRIVWPRLKHQPHVRFALLDWAGGAGGNVAIALSYPDDDVWPDDTIDPATGCYRRRYWLRVVARTQNRKRLSWFGPVRVRPPAPYIQPPTSAG
jgi:hypothetical protein